MTHGLGLLASLVGAFVLVSLSVEQGEAWHVVSAAVYGATLVSLYAASTLYLASMRGGGGWMLFGLVWGLASVGKVFKVLAAGRFADLSTIAYVLMGWLCIIAVKPMSVLLSSGALKLLGAGGVLYTVGIFFYRSDRVPYSHALWHLSIVAGSVCPLPHHRLVRARPERVRRSASARERKLGRLCIYVSKTISSHHPP